MLWFLLTTLAGAAAPWKYPHLIADCRILTTEGVLLRKFPGVLCAYLPNGDFFSASPGGLRAFDKEKKLKWEIPGYFHHSLEFNHDRTRLLALSSNIYEENGVRYREDVAMVVSLAGEVLHRVGTRELLKAGGGELHDTIMVPHIQKQTGAVKEISHFNSFHEIPTSLKRPHPVWGMARYVVNGAGHGTYLVDEQLKQVALRFVADPQYHGVHDAQITSEGHLLIFNNQVREGTQLYSAVQEYDLRTKRLRREVTGEPRGLFFSRYAGGVQRLDEDRWLFSDNLHGVYVWSHRQKKLLVIRRELHRLDGRDIAVQHVRNVDVSEFLAAHP